MNTALVNRFDAFRSILTLRQPFQATIDAQPLLKEHFDDLQAKVRAAEALLSKIAARSNAATVHKNARRADAVAQGAELGAALASFAAKTKNEMLAAKCVAWRSASALGSGNREAVLGSLRALIDELTDQQTAAKLYYETADIAALQTKTDAFADALDGKTQQTNAQVAVTEAFDALISEMSAQINDQFTRTVQSLESDLPDFAAAYRIARRVRWTPAGKSRSASTEEPPIETLKLAVEPPELVVAD